LLRRHEREPSEDGWGRFWTAYLEAHREVMRPYPEAAESLDRIRGFGVHLGVVSDVDIDFLDFALGAVRLRDRFDSITTSEEAGVGKPNPALFRLALQKAGSPPGEAAFVGEAMAKAFAFNKRFDGARYRPDAHWERLMFMDPAQDLADYSQLDERAAFTYEAIAMSKAMVTKTPGVGQAYLASYHDKEGHAFHGAKSYRLHVPPNPPAKQFWSVTLYDVDTRAIIQNKEQIADRSSRQPDLVKNPDGSVDLYFGPAMPKGPSALLRIGLEKNWIPTVPGKAWFAYFRFYAPLEAYFDTTWPLPDIERVQ